MAWSQPSTYGDTPPASRAHSFTAVGTKLFLFGGGDGTKCFNDLHIFDIGAAFPLGFLILLYLGI